MTKFLCNVKHEAEEASESGEVATTTTQGFAAAELLAFQNGLFKRTSQMH